MKKTTIPENLAKALLQLNLTEKEIATYVILLQNGPLGVQEISRESGINRVSIYSAIDELKSKGLLSESRKGKKKLFVAESPEKLKLYFEDAKEKLLKKEKLLNNSILPLLKALDISEEKKPQIKFFEGKSGIDKVFDEYILKNQTAINCGSYDTATRAISDEEEKKFFDLIKEKKVFYRMILEDTPLNRKFAEFGKSITHTKFLSPETKVPADIVVAGPMVALISYDKKTSVLIEDEIIARTMKVFLEFMWERL